MRYNVTTAFPNGIDNLIYFSDPSINHANTINEYNQLFKNGKINEAVEVVSADHTMHYSSAFLINKFSIQIKALQEFLQEKESTIENPMVHDNEEPVNTDEFYIWIAEE